jgi:PLP dependent protein
MIFANLQNNYDILKGRIEKSCQKSNRRPDEIRLIAVTKTHPVETVQALIDLGIRDIGENRVQEIEQKAPLLKGEFSLHLIGHLQTNKVAKVLPLVQWIQSIDSMRLADKINSSISTTAEKIKVLVEVNTSGETSKSGCTPSECIDLCEYVAKSPRMEFHGLMTVGPLEGGEKQTRTAFTLLRKLSMECGSLTPTGQSALSMGMSADFEWAIEEGATMIRVGSLLLGNRS